MPDNEGWVGKETGSIRSALYEIQRELDQIESAVIATAVVTRTTSDLIQKVFAMQLQMNTKIDTILSYLQPSQPVGFNITETVLDVQNKKETTMAKNKATVNLQILDDGKGVLYTISGFVNAAGTPVPNSGALSGVSSAPATLTVAADPGDPSATPPRPADTTGLVFLGSVVKPVVDATGVTVAFTDTLTNGTVINETSDPVDVVADSSPVGFTVSESAL